MSESEEIRVEEEGEDVAAKGAESKMADEFMVKGEELLETVKRLAREAGVRRIIIRNKDGRVLLEIPIVLGVAGIALLPAWSAVALIAALVTDCSIVVEKVVKAEKEPEADEAE